MVDYSLPGARNLERDTGHLAEPVWNWILFITITFYQWLITYCMMVSLLQVASTLVRLANLTLISIISDIKVKNDLRRSHLVRGERLVNDSIRITQGILNTLWEDRKKPNNAFAMERERIAATALLLEALQIVGLLDTRRITMQKHALFLKLPLERMKHGYFKIDAAGISDTCRLFIWPDKHLRGDTTLRIHFHKFEKFDYQYLEQALCKCISLYNEPQTRDIVLNSLRQRYMMCLRSLIILTQQKSYIFDTSRMQDLLAESQQIMRELGEENNIEVNTNDGRFELIGNMGE
uniref:Uncharacterized protein n=1 Tax=Avena sativa TaxID=4498 RepID=A0ACD5X531_AVESA